MLDQRGQLLRAAVGFAGCSMPSYDRALWALRTWLDSWAGIGRIAVGMARQGYDLQLTRYDERGGRATFYTTGMEHSPTSATGTGAHAVASGAAGSVGGARRAARPHLMAGKKRRLTRGDVAVIAAIAIGLLVSFVALIQWESSRECIRWSTRFDATEGGQIYRTQVCAEFRPKAK